MKAKLFGFTAALAVSLLAFASPALAQLPTTCSNALLHGDYAFTINGQIKPPGAPAFVPQQGVAMTHFDGDGNLDQVDFIMSNGAPSAYPPASVRHDGFRIDESGSYTVNPDCTGSLEIHFAGGAVIDVRFVLARDGKEIREVVKSITAPAPGGEGNIQIKAAIIANGKKLEPFDRGEN